MTVATAAAPVPAALRWLDDGAWWYWDLGAGTVSCSPRWYHDLGLEPYAAPVAMSALLRLLHPADREVLEDALLAVRSDGSSAYDLRLRLRHREGRYVVLRSRGTIEVGGPERHRAGWVVGSHEVLVRQGWPDGVSCALG